MRKIAHRFAAETSARMKKQSHGVPFGLAFQSCCHCCTSTVQSCWDMLYWTVQPYISVCDRLRCARHLIHTICTGHARVDRRSETAPPLSAMTRAKDHASPHPTCIEAQHDDAAGATTCAYKLSCNACQTNIVLSPPTQEIWCMAVGACPPSISRRLRSRRCPLLLPS